MPQSFSSVPASIDRNSVPQLDVIAATIARLVDDDARELEGRIGLVLADLAKREAEHELRLVRLEQATVERLALVKDGPAGPQGSPGMRGEPGPQGFPGERGERGVAGPEGQQGQQGLAGEKGERGEPGIAGPEGQQGPQGPQGQQGLTGEKGERGERGPQGDTGQVGIQGLQGLQGSQGLTGERGESGPQGPQGERGLQGEPGVQGERGLEGPPGPAAYVGEPRGLFDAGASYRKLDRVALNGSEWIARTDDPGPLPGEGWMLSAKVGAKGDRGERGPRGEPGVSIAEVTLGDYAVNLTFNDGTHLSVNLWPLFDRFRDEVGI